MATGSSGGGHAGVASARDRERQRERETERERERVRETERQRDREREREPAIYAGQVALGSRAALRESGQGVSGVAEQKLETIAEECVHYLRRCAHVRMLACEFLARKRERVRATERGRKSLNRALILIHSRDVL